MDDIDPGRNDIDPGRTCLTERQVQVLRLRERGLTQQDVAERIGTTAANVSAVERSARENVEKARRTLECVRLLRTATRFRAPEGTALDDLIDRIYELGDDEAVKIDYRKPELYAHVYETIEERLNDGRTTTPVEVGLSREGEVVVRVADDPGE